MRKGEAMDDLISRQAAIDALIRKTRPHDNGDGTTTICVMSEGLVREVITDLPTAEPRTGKWLSVFVDGLGFNGLMFECSECGKRSAGRTNFCAYCGADMRGERNEP